MKTRHFVLAALVALVTFASLRAVARYRRWPGRALWNYHGPHRFFGHRWNPDPEATPGFGAARPAGPPAPAVPLAPTPVAPTPSQLLATPAAPATQPLQ